VTEHFVPGVQLCAAFYEQAVRPLIERAHPGLRYAAALLGPGSDVSGFDTARSTDHDWGPRLQLFLTAEEHPALAVPLDELLRAGLPTTFAGFPTNFGPAGAVVQVMVATSGPVRHRVAITEPTTWYDHWLGFQPHQQIRLLDWLATPTQVLLEQSAGAVFHDAPGIVTAARAALAWYPDDVWRWLLAGQWQRIAEEEPFVGRCVEVGDELGAGVVTGRLVRDLARLQLLMARRYPPYSKWLGSAVAQVPGVAEPLLGALHATGRGREAALCRAYEHAAEVHNALALTPPLDPRVRGFHDRPYRVLDAARFADALRATVTDPVLAPLPPIGGLDTFLDNTNLAGDRVRRRAAVAAILGC